MLGEDSMHIKRFIVRAALILAALMVFAGCDQPGNATPEPPIDNGRNAEDSCEIPEEQVYMTGIEIASPPDKTLYPQSFRPDDINLDEFLDGLVVNALYSDGTAEPLAYGEYDIDTSELGTGLPGNFINWPVTIRKMVVELTRTERTQTITAGGETYTNTYVQVSTKDVQAEAGFVITIAKDDRVPESVTLNGNPPATQYLGAAFSMGNVSVTGHYSDNTSESLSASLCKVTGYDPRKRGGAAGYGKGKRAYSACKLYGNDAASGGLDDKADCV
jgi:hypothetical protein